MQERFDKNPGAMRTRRETVEHPFGTIKMWRGRVRRRRSHARYGNRRGAGCGRQHTGSPGDLSCSPALTN